MKMKKVIALLLAATFCACVITACGSSSTSSTNSASKTTTSESSSSPIVTEPGPVETEEPSPVDEATYTFVVVNHDSADSMGEHWLEEVLGYVAEESGGRITFEYWPGGSMFGAAETIDAVKSGAADICWMTSGTYGGVFPLSEFINLPGNGVDSAQFGNAVMNTMYNEIPEVAAEWDGWHILCLHGTSMSPISTVGTKIESPSDLGGLRLRVAGTIPTLYVNNIGATATAMPTSDVYDSLAKNALDGMCNDWHNIDCFNLYEPIDYCLDVSVNMTVSAVLMNEDSYNDLPEDLQAIFDKYFASGYATDMAGYYWDSCRYWVADEMRDNGVDVYDPTDEVYNYLWSDEIVSETAQGYIDFLNEKGYDGQAMYDKFMEIVDRYAADYAHVWDEEFNYTDWDEDVDGYVPLWAE